MALGMTRIAAAVLLALLLMAGQPARAENEPKVITLACDGTLTLTYCTSKADPEPVQKMGVVVNLAEHTVSFGAYVVNIDSVGAADITFSGESKVQAFGQPAAVSVSIMGDLDRVTGHLVATQFSTAAGFNFDLLCKPTTRLF